MWLLFSLEFLYGVDLSFLGVKPRNFYGLIGILTAPLIHGNLLHLVSNTFPLLFLGMLLFYFHGRNGSKVFWMCYFIPNILVWLFSFRISYHIGASGLIYGLASFLMVYGILRREFMSFLISLGLVFFYGGIFFYGLLPVDPRISWESHLFGALVGLVVAVKLAGKRSVEWNPRRK